MFEPGIAEENKDEDPMEFNEKASQESSAAGMEITVEPGCGLVPVVDAQLIEVTQ